MPTVDRRQGVTGGVAIKAPCRVASTANISSLSGLLTIDGVTVAAGDRVLVKDQTDSTQNGIYIADSGTWSRARDFDGSNDCVQGTLVLVTSGTQNGSTVYELTTSNPVIGTTSLSFTPTGAAALALASAYMRNTVLPSETQDAARLALGEGSISALDPRFGVVADGTTDNATAFDDLVTWVAAQSYPPEVVFPPGVYKYSVSPNWAIANSVWRAQGEVRLRYSGTGNAVILDGGAEGGGVFNVNFGPGNPFIVEAPATAQNAVYCRALHHSYVGARPKGAGTAYAGLYTGWCVLTTFDVPVTSNGEDWYQGAEPAIGWELAASARTISMVLEPGFTAYCFFPNPKVERTDIGIKLTSTLGNMFLGGTAEGCATYGVFATSGANGDFFTGLDMEVNGTADFFNQGDGLELRDCDSTNSITFGSTSKRGIISGGKHKSILLDVGSRSHFIGPLEFNRVDAPGGTIVDSGAGNRIDWNNIVDGTNNLFLRRARRVVHFKDEFMGDILNADWQGRVGSDGSCVAPATNASIGGSVILKSGADAGGTMALNGSLLDRGALEWKMSSGGFWMEFRVGLLTITNCAWFIGMTDQVAALEMPFTLSGTTLTSNATDAFGILFDTDATTDTWNLVGVANNVDATRQDAAVAPVADTYEYWRIEVTTAGVAKFFRNGSAIGTTMSGAVTPSVALTPVFAGFSRAALQKQAYMDFIEIEQFRV